MNGEGGITEVVELNEAWIRLDSILHRNGEQIAEHGRALQGFAVAGGRGASNGKGAAWITEVGDNDGPGSTAYGIEISTGRVVGRDFSIGPEIGQGDHSACRWNERIQCGEGESH
ncbi:hypothetical protein [Synechococcus sp. BO 8801]|uniref:hypothetical protein n=1 Tax=Synechococcus sp. BO 8801 TaxID=169670 RepID=UPI001E5177AC|nr:hypothetical protein [Synechococcus sp. BO 8801]